MPAKKVVEGDKILKTALKIVKKCGMEGLNIRSLAKACNCSTQPIYNCFHSMTELKKEVAEKIVEIHQSYLRAEIASGKYPEYKATGMGYIRFAKEEPQFFKYLFMRDRRGSETEDDDSGFIDEVFKIMERNGIDENRAAELHAHMWVWVHGIATMYATGFLDWDWETVERMLTGVFLGVKSRLNI